MTKDVEELDEVPDHGPINPALRIIQCDICATESSGFMHVLKHRMGRLSVCGPGIRGCARTRSLPPLVCLPLIDTMSMNARVVSILLPRPYGKTVEMVDPRWGTRAFP